MKKGTWISILGGFTAILLISTGCATTETGRRQLKLVSNEQEMQLGLTAFDEMKKETPISKNAKYNEQVTRVGMRIAEQAKSRLPNAQWEFVVFDSPEANAFCLPGGKVGVYTGILPITETETGLAVVIGHEVAHASQHHGAERMSDAMAVQGVSQAASGLVNEKYQAAAATAFGLVGKVGVELPFSRKQESEADHVGLLYMARAGYDPQEAVRFWERFAASHKGQSGGMAFLRTHPVDSVRIADLKKWMPEAMAEYQRAKGISGPVTAPARGAAPPQTGRDAGSTVIGR
jgi:metalloendopeptidase OMA1, mitochondrial